MTKLAKALNIAEYQLIFPEYAEETRGKSGKPPIKSLIALKESLKKEIDTQFEGAIDTGDFT